MTESKRQRAIEEAAAEFIKAGGTREEWEQIFRLVAGKEEPKTPPN